MLRKDRILDPDLVEQIVNLWTEDLMPRSKVAQILGIEFDPSQPDGYKTHLTNMMQFDYETRGKKVDMAIEMYKEKRSKELDLDFDIKTKYAENKADKDIESINEKAEAAQAALDAQNGVVTKPKVEEDSGGSSWRSFDPSWEDPEDDDPDPDPSSPTPGGDGNSGNGGKPPVKPNGFVGGNGAGTELYVSPDATSLILDYLPSDDALTIVARNHDASWIMVNTMDKDTGWLKKSFITSDVDYDSLPVSHLSVSQTAKNLTIDDTIDDDGIYNNDDEAVYGIPVSIDTLEPHYEMTNVEARAKDDTPTLLKSPADFSLNEKDVITMAENILERIQNELIKKDEKEYVNVEKNSQLTESLIYFKADY